MSRIALLHEHDDRQAISRLIESISRAGHVTMRLDDDLRLGESVTHSIIKLIQQCDMAIVVVSKGRRNIYFELGLLLALDKPLLLLAKNNIALPSDLAGLKAVRYDEQSLTDFLAFKIEQNISNVLSHRSSNFKSSYEPRFRPLSQHSDLQSISRGIEDSSLSVFARASLFEDWLLNILNGISDWEVVEKPKTGKDLGYDFAIWNDIDDPILLALGNPIVFEAKASKRLDIHQIQQGLNYAKRSGLKSFVLCTLGNETPKLSEQIYELYERRNIIPIILDRNSLQQVREPFDLIKQIRLKAVALFQSGVPGV